MDLKSKYNLSDCFVSVEKIPDEVLKQYLHTQSKNESAAISNTKAKRQHETTTEFSVRYGTDAYVWEFQRFLTELQDRNERVVILKELKKNGIKRDLLIRNKKGELKINEKLVIWIMKRQCNGLHLELSWNSLVEAIKKVHVNTEESKNQGDRKEENVGG